MPEEVRLIKRYPNRKLYDTVGSTYVTLEELAVLIREGHDIRIVDNRTQEDLTAVTMAQILVGEGRENRDGLSRPLRDVILQSGQILTRKTRALTEPVAQLRTTMEGSVQRLLRSGEERAEGTIEGLRSWYESQTQAIEARIEEGLSGVRSWTEAQSRSIEELQARIDERMRSLSMNLNVVSTVQKETAALRRRVELLEARLRRKEAQEAQQQTDAGLGEASGQSAEAPSGVEAAQVEAAIDAKAAQVEAAIDAEAAQVEAAIDAEAAQVEAVIDAEAAQVEAPTLRRRVRRTPKEESKGGGVHARSGSAAKARKKQG